MEYSSDEHDGPSLLDLLRLSVEQKKIRWKEQMLKFRIRRSIADRILGWKITTAAMIVLTLLAVGFVAMWLLIALVCRSAMKTERVDQ